MQVKSILNQLKPTDIFTTFLFKIILILSSPLLYGTVSALFSKAIFSGRIRSYSIIEIALAIIPS
jgi:hypothetical protein